HHRHAHQPTEHGGHEHATPLLLPAHTFVLHPGWLSSRPHTSIAESGGPGKTACGCPLRVHYLLSSHTFQKMGAGKGSTPFTYVRYAEGKEYWPHDTYGTSS